MPQGPMEKGILHPISIENGDEIKLRLESGAKGILHLKISVCGERA